MFFSSIFHSWIWIQADPDPQAWLGGCCWLNGSIQLVRWYQFPPPPSLVCTPSLPPAKTKPGPPRPICFPLPSYTQCTHCQKKLRNVHTSIYVRPICLRNICTIKMSVSQHLKLEVRNCPPFSDFLTLSSF